MYLNTVFKYNVFKYCSALTIVSLSPLSAFQSHVGYVKNVKKTLVRRSL